MSADYRMNWEGRPVVFAEFDLRKGREVRECGRRNEGEEGAYVCLAASLRYADTNEPVFASSDEVWRAPNRLYHRLQWLAGEALRVNGFTTEDPDAPPPSTNGHDRSEQAASPSP